MIDGPIKNLVLTISFNFESDAILNNHRVDDEEGDYAPRPCGRLWEWETRWCGLRAPRGRALDFRHRNSQYLVLYAE